MLLEFLPLNNVLPTCKQKHLLHLTCKYQNLRKQTKHLSSLLGLLAGTKQYHKLFKVLLLELSNVQKWQTSWLLRSLIRSNKPSISKQVSSKHFFSERQLSTTLMQLICEMCKITTEKLVISSNVPLTC